MKKRTIRIFLSSTFRDMAGEREIIVKKVLPDLQKDCLQRQVELIFVDLRWGITAEQSETNQTIKLCLDQVKRAHETPVFFIALLAERYGWLPESLPKAILQDYPWLSDMIGSKSATEMEIAYAEQLQQTARKEAFVYVRDKRFSEAIQADLGMTSEGAKEQQALATLKARLLADADFNSRQQPYENLETLAEWLRQDLWQAIDQLFPEAEIPDALARERQAHQDFAASRRKVYIADNQLLADIEQAVETSNKTLLITGDSGLGKSALLANWLAAYQQKHPEVFVIEHYIGGGSAQSADLIPMLTRILSELKQHFNWSEDLPDHDKIVNDFATWLYKIKEPTVLVLDAINQLREEKYRNLFWLPETLPEKLTVVVSATPETAEIIEKQHTVMRFSLAPLTVTAQHALINEFLARHGKALDIHQQEKIIRQLASRNPLYLRTLLEELRVFGGYETLNQYLEAYLKADHPQALFALVLQRLETDYGENVIKNLLLHLACARDGLSENELLALLALPRQTFDPAFFTLHEHLVNKGGQYQFFHNFLAQAVAARYGNADSEAAYRRQQVTYWQTQPASKRKQRELPWLLSVLDDKAALAEVLLDIALIFAIGMDAYELLIYWHITEKNTYPEEYQSAFEAWRQGRDEDAEAGRIANDIGFFLHTAGHFRAAEPLVQRSLAIREQVLGLDHPHVASSLNSLAALYDAQGRYSEAEPLYQRSLAIWEQALGLDHPDVAYSLNNLAALYDAQGRLGEAEPLYQRSLAIREQVFGPHHPDVATSLNGLAELYRVQGHLAEAEPLYQRSLSIKEQALGPHHPSVATSLNNLALLYYEQGRYAEAEPLYQRSLTIREHALGQDHPDVATSLNNLAGLYQAQGRLDKADPLLKRSLAIRERALGPDHPDVAQSLNNLAGLYYAQGRYTQAEPLFERSLAIREQALGQEHPDVAQSLNNLAGLYQAQSHYAKAEPLYQRSLRIREHTLGKDHPYVAQSLNNLAGLYKAQGRYRDADPLYQRSLAIFEQALGLDHPAVANSLNNLAALYYAQGRLAEAEPLYQRSLRIFEQALGKDHPNTQKVAKNLFGLLTEMQQQSDRVQTVRYSQPKPMPNEPCPCGSGKKYKKCCGLR